MTYRFENGGRDDPDLSAAGRDDFWTFAAVEERLVEALRLWRRSPGGGHWPFAGDAPWQLMTRATRVQAGEVKGMDVQRLLLEDDERETSQWQGRDRRRGLSREEVARRDEATEWLTWVAEDSRRVVVAVLAQRASGKERTDWARVKRQIGSEAGHKGVYRRYSRALYGIAVRLNGGTAVTRAG